MTTVRCGRLDAHDPHEWRGLPIGVTRERYAYACPGHVITEMERTRFDAADDAAEERAIRERREG